MFEREESLQTLARYSYMLWSISNILVGAGGWWRGELLFLYNTNVAQWNYFAKYISRVTQQKPVNIYIELRKSKNVHASSKHNKTIRQSYMYIYICYTWKSA